MSEAENSADMPPSEPDLIARARAEGDPVSGVELENLEILISPPGQEGSAGTPADLIAAGPEVARGLAPQEAPAEAGALLEAMKSLGERLDRRLDALQVLFEREQRAEAARERVVDRLHAELQEYKQDLLLKVQRPIFIDLIQLHDDIGKMIETKPPADVDVQHSEHIRGLLESIQTGIEDILYRQGVEPFVRDGNEFDPRRQRAVSTVPTDDPAAAKTIAARLRKGFQAGDKVIRPEIVTVYAHQPARRAGPAD